MTRPGSSPGGEVTAASMEVGVAASHAEVVTDRLWSEGAIAVAEHRDPAGVCLVAGFADVEAARSASDRLTGWAAEAGVDLVVGEPVADDAAWADAWRAHARPVRVGPVVVVPAWMATPDDVDDARDVVVRLDAARSFGDGSHPTTRLALAALVEIGCGGRSILDVGCGSGVLAVAAAALGAGRVVAVDVDPAAVATTVDNAARNGVSDGIEASTAPVREVVARSSFDVVVANLGGRDAVHEMAADLARGVSPGGSLVVSGLLAGREMGDRTFGPGFVAAEREQRDGWVAQRWRRAV